MASLERKELQLKNGRKLSYLKGGPEAGALLIFCHGWPAIARTWERQLNEFAALGFRVVAPDMPGYGSSSAEHQSEHYSLEEVNRAMVELLASFEQEAAVWIGHDWGAVAVWSFAAHYPEKTKAVCCLARPYHTLELGLEEVLPTVNRDVFPENDYPYGQYDYQVYFERSFEAATNWFEKDIEGVVRAIYLKGSPDEVGKPGVTATVTKAGGWFGGASAPPSTLRHIPAERICIDEAMCEDVVAAMKKTGFWAPNAWYTNHAKNRKYSLEKWKNDGYLDMPVLFIGANWDAISDIKVSTIAEAQRKFCSQLTEASLNAGHWVALEKPDEVNALIAKWLRGSVPEARDSPV